MQKKNTRNNFLNRHRFLLTGLLCLFGICLLSAQDKKKEPEKKKTRVDLLHAEEAQADKILLPDVQILIRSVKLRHDSMYMYCDSALIYEKTNSVEAFGNVRMEQGDTLFIYGDYLYYDGMSQLAMLRENVRMINRNTVLTTDSLNYDRLYNLGYYFVGQHGTIQQFSLLCSGVINTSFGIDVVLITHNIRRAQNRSNLRIGAIFQGIRSQYKFRINQLHIMVEYGYFRGRTIFSPLGSQHILFIGQCTAIEGKKLTGDSIFYDRVLGYGEAFDNVQMNDNINRNMLTGNYCFYNEITGSALATQRAVAIDYSQGDSLFMHGDTLRLITYHINTDSMFREMRVYHKVRAYRTDVQAVCDSLVYNSKDSCMTMYTDPILWHGSQQLLGEEIKVYMNDSTIDWAHIINQALAVEQKDSVHYNQVTGKEMKGFFVGGDMRQVDVNGNVLVVFYPIDDKDSTMIGLNYSEGSFLRMLLKERRMEQGAFIGKANGTLYPMDQIPADKYKLPPFVWFDYIRPRNKEDIFEWRGKKAGEQLQKSDRKPIVSPRNMNIKRNK